MSMQRYPVPTHLAVEPAVLRLGVGLTLRRLSAWQLGAASPT